MCLCALCGVQAQTIKNGQRFWDGGVLYTAKVDAQGNVVMNGISEHEGGFRFMLSKVLNKPGQYALFGYEDGYLPIKGESGAVVEYINKEGMNFLAVRKANGDVCHTLVLTPDNLQNCVAQERFAETEMEVSDVITGMLLNNTYLSQFPRHKLRYMRNEILARKGYRFQSDDLKHYFEAQPWYRPVANNNSVNLNIIETTNIQLIKSAEALSDDDRGYVPKPEDFPGGLAEDGRDPNEGDMDQSYFEETGKTVQYDGQEYIRVTNAKEFVRAISSGNNILVAKNTTINLTLLLNDRAWWENNFNNFKWHPGTIRATPTREEICSDDVSDGRQLTIYNYKQILIRGEGNSTLVVEPRYAFVLNFVNCEQIEIRNLTIGHTVGGSCEGGVIGVKGGWRISIQNSDLYGCGTYGVQLEDTRDFQLYHSKIRDCTYGIMTLKNVEYANFDSCDFFNNLENDFGLVESSRSNVVFNKCRFFANNGDAKLFKFDRKFMLMNCEVYHPTENLGAINLATQEHTMFSENPFDTDIMDRPDVGPDVEK